MGSGIWKSDTHPDTHITINENWFHASFNGRRIGHYGHHNVNGVNTEGLWGGIGDPNRNNGLAEPGSELFDQQQILIGAFTSFKADYC